MHEVAVWLHEEGCRNSCLRLEDAVSPAETWRLGAAINTT
jgi:hypothetical protein